MTKGMPWHWFCRKKLKTLMKTKFANNWLCCKKPWNIKMPSIFVMGAINSRVTRQLCAWCTHMGCLQNGCWNYVYSCEIMYFQSNSKILVTFKFPKCYIFNNCMYAKWDWVIWNYLCQFCERGFWVWIRGIVCVYDGKSPDNFGSIFSICIYLYNVNMVHNMLTLMLDMCYKLLDVMKTCVGRAKVIQTVVEYDNKILMPLLVVAFLFLNHGIDGRVELTPIDDNDNSIFGVLVTWNELFCKGCWKMKFFYSTVYMWGNTFGSSSNSISKMS